MLRIYKDDKQYPRKVLDDEGELFFCVLDDDIIEITCSFDRMKKHFEKGEIINAQYNIASKDMPFVELKSILYLFFEIINGQISIIASVELVNEVVDEKWSLSDFVNELKRQLKHFKDIKIRYFELEIDAFIWFERLFSSSHNLEKKTSSFAEQINELLESTRKGLRRNTLKERHFASEKVFCEEILTPLFRHMGFENVIFNHGVREFGKDYILSEITKMNTIRYYGVQVKVGNIKGGVNSQIDNIIYQIKEAFEIPFSFKDEEQKHYISELYIITNGKFTANAKEKIRYKIPKGIYGAVHFLDQEDIENLIAKYR